MNMFTKIVVTVMLYLGQGASMHAQQHDFAEYVIRRRTLVEAIKKEYSATSGTILLFAGFETDRHRFRQESSFFYLTGLHEPSTVLMMQVNGAATLYVPHCGSTRAKWIASPIELTQENSATLGMDHILPLGKECNGYQLH